MKTASKYVKIYALCDPRDSDTYYYIGQTSQRVAARVNKHIAGALGKHNDSNKEKQLWIKSLLDQGLRPIGVILTECSLQCADEIESNYIERYIDEHPLFNVSSGGLRDGSYCLSEEARKKISNYANHRTEEHKRNNREANKGRKFTEEQKKKLSESHLKGKRSIRVNKNIGQYDLEGNFINQFKTTADAIIKTGIPRGAIQNSLHGRTRTGYGYQWKFID